MTDRCKCCGQLVRKRIQTPLYRARIAAGFDTIAKAAEALNIDQSQLGKWESGARRPGVRSLIKLADLYRVPLDELVNDRKRSA